MSSLPIAYVRYEQVVMWVAPGGHHHVKFLKRGDEVKITAGWTYEERTWKDKRYVKVVVDGKTGYVLASALDDHKANPPVVEEDEPDADEYVDDGVD